MKKKDISRQALKGLNVPKTGQPTTTGVGMVVTKTLVVMGDPMITAPPGRTRGAMLRIATDSKGNLYTTETWEGKRIQKFVYKGMGRVRTPHQRVVWPGTR